MIDNVRNLQAVDLSLKPALNLFHGDNGAGKTSLLEAVNLLALGRSFRHHRARPLIHTESQQLTVFAEVGGSGSPTQKLGISKNRQAETSIRIDGRPVYTAAELAQYLPILNLNAQSFVLIEGPPKPRRQLLDWLTFHVEPLFLPAWRDLQMCLKQRNSALRHGKIRPAELKAWDGQLSELAEKIDRYRARAYHQLQLCFAALVEHVPELENVRIEYKKGWTGDIAFAELLINQRQHDAERGFTQYGPHRADLAIKAQGRPAAEVLSRGQSKIAIAALVLALAAAFKALNGKPLVLLVDDLPSELDVEHRHQMGALLADSGAQLLVTGVEKAPLEEMWPPGFANEAGRFHVKQGRVITDF